MPDKEDRPVSAQAAIDRSNAAFVAGDPDTAADELITALRQTTKADRDRLIATMLQALKDRAAKQE
ncbi:hypothetical protein [Streptomyces formicae]